MLSWVRLEILNPKGLESSIVYLRQCSSVIVSPTVVTLLLSKANPTFSYPMVKTGLQFFSFHVECKYNTGINIFVYYWRCHLGQAFGRAITKVTLSVILKANLIPRALRKDGCERALGTRLVESTVKMSKMSNHRIHLPSAQPPPPFKIKRQPAYNTLVHSLRAVFCTATSKLMR